jgi:hypothetical protein
MEAIRSSETSGTTQRTTRRHIPEEDTLQNHRCENLKSYRAKMHFTSQSPSYCGNFSNTFVMRDGTVAGGGDCYGTDDSNFKFNLLKNAFCTFLVPSRLCTLNRAQNPWPILFLQVLRCNAELHWQPSLLMAVPKILQCSCGKCP